ncbi:MAG TPA: tripartite tricarboxylate transporter substrate binding protein [Beijerinckiaceae bacterium]
MTASKHIVRTLALGATIIAASFAPASAQTYPSKPVTLVVGFAPGGPNDILGRLVARAMSARMGQPFQVENKPGSSGNIATKAVVDAAPDGHTLLLIGPANAINTSLYQNQGFDFVRDIAPIGGITREALVMVTHPSVPAKTVAEFVAYAKADPVKVNMASTGNGSSPHVTALLFKRATGLDLPITHFAGGGPALKEMIAGRMQMMFEPMSAAIEPVRTGSLRALGVTSQQRSSALPDTPTIAETIPGFEASAVTGLGAPRGTPDAIIRKLNAELNAALQEPATRKELADTGGDPLPGSPEDFAKLLAGEIEKWGAVIKAAGVTAGR